MTMLTGSLTQDYMCIPRSPSITCGPKQDAIKRYTGQSVQCQYKNSRGVHPTHTFITCSRTMKMFERSINKCMTLSRNHDEHEVCLQKTSNVVWLKRHKDKCQDNYANCFNIFLHLARYRTHEICGGTLMIEDFLRHNLRQNETIQQALIYSGCEWCATIVSTNQLYGTSLMICQFNQWKNRHRNRYN